MTVDICIARHGQNEDNANGILNGHRDLPLTKIGRQQARDLGKGIRDAGLRFDAVYSSPLVRSLETAEIACEAFGLKIQPKILPELIERDMGSMTGQKVTDIERLCAPDIIKTETLTYFLHAPGAETFPQIVERAHKVLETIRQAQHRGNVLIVCHGDIGKMIYAAATGRDWESVLRNFHFGNGDLIKVSPDDTAHMIKLEQYN